MFLEPSKLPASIASWPGLGPMFTYYCIEYGSNWGVASLDFFFFLTIFCSMCFLPLTKYSCLKHSWFLVFRVLVKLYILSWRTNEEKLLCLKYRGRTFSANSFDLLTIKPFPEGFQKTVALFSVFYTGQDTRQLRLKYTYIDNFIRFDKEIWDISCASVWRGVAHWL